LKEGKIKTPAGLSTRARAFYRRTVTDFGLEGEEQALTILELACRALSAAEAAHTELAAYIATAHRVTVDAGTGRPIPHPAARVAKEQSESFERLLRGLDLELVPKDPRPPRRTP